MAIRSLHKGKPWRHSRMRTAGTTNLLSKNSYACRVRAIDLYHIIRSKA